MPDGSTMFTGTATASTAPMSLASSAVLPDDRIGRFARRLILVILAAVVFAIFWAAWTPVDEIVSADGTIGTTVQIERLEHPLGGVVSEVHARPGDTVERGDVLITLDSASYARERKTLLAQQRALDGEWYRVTRMLQGAVVRLDEEAIQDLDPEEQAFWSEQAHLSARLDLITAEDRVIEAELTALATQEQLLQRETAILRAQLDRFRGLKNSVSRSRIDEIERQVLAAQQKLVGLAGVMASQRLAIETNELRRVELLTDRQRDAAVRRAELRRDIVAVEQSLAELDVRIAQSVMVADIDGTILDMSISTEREVLGPGDLVAEIVPLDSPIQAEIEVLANRIGSLRLGMPARLRVDTFDFTEFGTITGRIAEISPTSFEREDGISVYRAIITLPNRGKDVQFAGRTLRPGMTVTADVIGDRKTVLSYLLKPLRVFRDQAFSEP